MRYRSDRSSLTHNISRRRQKDIVMKALFKAKAIYAYASDKPSDLSFEQDDIIDVIGKRPDGWWIVRVV